MSRRIVLVFAALLALSFVGIAQEPFRGSVVGVMDGDTLSVLRDGRGFTIRVHGIDCPEHGQDFSARAKQFTSARVFGKTVTVEPRGSDRYSRLVARVVIDGDDLGLALVTAGLAWHATPYSSDADLARAEATARNARVGLWTAPNPLAPWDYRRPTPVADTSGPFHGNVRNRVFHRSGCPNYACANCTQAFRTREEAVAAGFRPAGDCKR